MMNINLYISDPKHLNGSVHVQDYFCIFNIYSASLKFHQKYCVFVPFKVFEEPEDPSSRSFFSEIISSISDVKFSHSGRYMMTRDYLSVKVWDLNMENRPVETYQVQSRSYHCNSWHSRACTVMFSEHDVSRLQLIHSSNTAGTSPKFHTPLKCNLANNRTISLFVFFDDSHLLCFCFRYMSTYVASCARSTRTTAFSTSLSAVGTVQTGA